MSNAISFRQFLARDEFDIKPDWTPEENYSVVGSFPSSRRNGADSFSVVSRVTRKNDGNDYARKVSFFWDIIVSQYICITNKSLKSTVRVCNNHIYNVDLGVWGGG